ncbi:MAG TPA: type II secretion system protein GspE, partial [Thauera sp.]|nr:type II secretion system protein GspE [Thauera sp.]
MSQPSLPYAFARSQGVLLRGGDEAQAELLVRSGAALGAVNEARRFLRRPLRIETATPAAFELALAQAYGDGERNAAEVVADVGQEIDLAQLMTELPAVEDLLERQDDAPIIRMINALLAQAVRDRASDVHIEPYEQSSVVRLRRDGV